MPAVALSFLFGSFAILAGWRGSDYPAQLFRVKLFRQTGFTMWNNQWYAGHATPGYGILAPALGAMFGPLLVGLVSCVAVSASFAVLTKHHWGRQATVGSAIFSAGTIVNLAVGRLPFALGLALGLQALVQATRPRHKVLGLGLALLCPLASPVAGVFLIIAGVSWAAGNATKRNGFRQLLCNQSGLIARRARIHHCPRAVV